jgi:deoxyribose-phosphate aldolase
MENNSISTKTPRDLALFIQFTQLNPDATRAQMTRHIELCRQHRFQAAMVAPCWVPLAKDILAGTDVRTASFIDFGMGSASVSGKAALIRDLKRLGADEVDYAPNMGFLLSGMFAEFQDESRAIVEAAEGMPVKAMLQMGMIADEGEKKRAIALLEEAGVDWIKNSSGGWPPGATDATVADIRFIKRCLKGRSRVKASGGINNYETAKRLIEAGAELLGTSKGLEIIGATVGEEKVGGIY